MSNDRIPACIEAVRLAGQSGSLTAGAVENITQWLTDSRYEDFRDDLVGHIERQEWKTLDDVFYTVIPFGTGGRRGRMHPIGCNAINVRTIGESAQGLAEYVLEQETGGRKLACAIAYDTRHNSRVFAELCAEIMVAHGFTVYFLDDYRSTPQLSFLVRRRQCDCGVMVTASHNPPSDNAVKVYWNTGGQVLPPHDKAIIEKVAGVGTLRRKPFAEALAAGEVVICTEDTDREYQDAVASLALPGPRNLGVVYSPLHGVGRSSVEPLLRRDGFDRLEVFAGHAEPDGDFPNVPDHVSNPENPRVFDALVERAREVGADLAIATDPDCDRMGCAAPTTLQSDAPWATLSGNQISALLCDYVLSRGKTDGKLVADAYVVTTLVTTRMIRRIAESYGVSVCDDLLVGFKWICGEMDRRGPDRFLFGAEESHGYLIGQHARDKDGAVACQLIAELAAELREEGKSLHEKLDALYWQHGCHAERLLNVKMEGSAGMQKMVELMQSLRESPPSQIGGMPVAALRDYESQTLIRSGGERSPLPGPQGNLVILDLEEAGNYVAVRPSGTEPKVKFYLFGFTPAEQLADLEDAKTQLSQRLDALSGDLRRLA